MSFTVATTGEIVWNLPSPLIAGQHSVAVMNPSNSVSATLVLTLTAAPVSITNNVIYNRTRTVTVDGGFIINNDGYTLVIQGTGFQPGARVNVDGQTDPVDGQTDANPIPVLLPGTVYPNLVVVSGSGFLSTNTDHFVTITNPDGGVAYRGFIAGADIPAGIVQGSGNALSLQRGVTVAAQAQSFLNVPTNNGTVIVLLHGTDVVAAGGTNVVSNDGGSLINNLSAVVSNDGGSLVNGDAANLISQDGNGLIPIPSSLISQDGNGLISQDGNGIVAQGGGNIVAQGGGNFISLAAGNFAMQLAAAIISQDGNGIVAQGAGNIVAQGGGNFGGGIWQQLLQRKQPHRSRRQRLSWT